MGVADASTDSRNSGDGNSGDGNRDDSSDDDNNGAGNNMQKQVSARLRQTADLD